MTPGIIPLTLHAWPLRQQDAGFLQVEVLRKRPTNGRRVAVEGISAKVATSITTAILASSVEKFLRGALSCQLLTRYCWNASELWSYCGGLRG
jgi:hypothetical protein